MTTEEIKQQARHTAKLVPQSQRELFLSEIDSLINKTVQMTEERIVDLIDKSQGYECVLPEIDPSLGELTSADIDCVQTKYGQIVFKRDLISLITNKNEFVQVKVEWEATSPDSDKILTNKSDTNNLTE